MTDFTKVQQALERRGYTVRTFAAAEEAAAYLDGAIDGKTVGFGGSATLDALGVYDKLAAHNTVIWHWKQEANAARKAAMQTQVYLSSANGLAESGEIVNIDGTKDYATVDNALAIVERLEHRAGKDAEGKTGDGVGIMVPGPERGCTPARPAAGEEDALRREGGPLLRLPES